MTPVPPFFFGAVLTFWGWRTDLLLFGFLAGLVLESAHLFRGRWDFTDTEYNRLWDVCALIFLGVGLVLRFSDDPTRAPYRFFQWFPLIFFVMALGHVYSTRSYIPLSAFSWFLRRKGTEGGDRPIAFGWIYYAVCLISAGATNHDDPWYYLGVAAFSGAALWVNRPHRLSIPGWVAVFLLAVTVGYFAQGKMQALQSYLEGRVSQLLIHFGRREFDPRHSRTSIGQIGSIKTSSRIVLKVRPDVGPIPPRLRQATYFSYEDGLWEGTRRQFEALPLENDLTSWTLVQSTNASGSIRIIQRLNRRQSLLSIPLGSTRLEELLSTSVETNSLGVVRVRENPSLASYRAKFNQRDRLDSPPRDSGRDLRLPVREAPALAQVARELNVDGAPAQAKVQAVQQFFETEGFRYSTYQSASDVGDGSESPLARFLLKTRTGHCEFYATATVLLLRQLGVPARYATGYAVQESSDQGEEYVVRDQHAHAWALAYVNNRWVEVDTTPADWAAAEEAEQPPWQGLKEWWSSFTFGFLEWRWLGEGGWFRTISPWLIGILVAYLGWRVFGRRMLRSAKAGQETEIWPGADSEFYLLERKFERTGLARLASETPARWVQRIEQESIDLPPSLMALVRLHYRYRFDPAGINEAEREELRDLVRGFLGSWQATVK